MNLILFGFKRCGKTHFGKLLASQLNYHFIDTDHLIEDYYEKNFYQNLKCGEISHKIGLLTFRALERKVIRELKIGVNAIISLGGGAILDSNNVEILKKMGTLVYLELDEETLRERTLNAKHLPIYLDRSDPKRSFDKIYQERKPLYEQINALRLNIQGKNEQEVLEMLLKLGPCHGK